MKRGTPLKRKTPLRRRKPMRRGRFKTSYARRPRDLAFLRWARHQPCAARELSTCTGHVQADHAGRRGMAQKSADNESFGLCSLHHAQRTAFAGPFKTWNKAQMREWLADQVRAATREYEAHLARERRYA
jgi:hypothetical protein